MDLLVSFRSQQNARRALVVHVLAWTNSAAFELGLCNVLCKLRTCVGGMSWVACSAGKTRCLQIDKDCLHQASPVGVLRKMHRHSMRRNVVDLRCVRLRRYHAETFGDTRSFETY